MRFVASPSLEQFLVMAPRSLMQRAAQGMVDLMSRTRRMASLRGGLLSELVGDRGTVHAWEHLPDNDAYDPASGYRWYYHCHSREGRTVGEHGHFHLFGDVASGHGVTHLLAISVSDRGMPIGLFTTNRWVTDERLQPAVRVQRLIRNWSCASPQRLHRVHAWIDGVLRAFSPQVRWLLAERDRQLAVRRASAGSNVTEDRRVALLSRCRVDLFAQAVLLDRMLTHSPGTIGEPR